MVTFDEKKLKNSIRDYEETSKPNRIYQHVHVKMGLSHTHPKASLS